MNRLRGIFGVHAGEDVKSAYDPSDEDIKIYEEQIKNVKADPKR